MQNLVLPISTETHAVNGPPQGQWTAADWETLPEDGNRYEIINGELFMSTAPSNFHQWIIFNLVELVGTPVKRQGLGYPAFAPTGVFMPRCEPVQPDFLIVLKNNEHIIHDRRIYGVPDLLVEVISQGSRDYDEDVKKAAYEKASVPEYAVIDPEKRQLRRYQLNTSGQYPAPQIFNEADRVTLTTVPSVTFRVGELFAGAPDTTL
jgi:Uma2 family endonuclease